MLFRSDTTSTSNALVTIKGISRDVDKEAFGLGPDDVAAAAVIDVIDVNKKITEIRPVFAIRGRQVFSNEEKVEELGLKISFLYINPENGKVTLGISEKKDNKREYIIMKAIVFPYINVLWTGSILLIIGTIMALRKRIRDLSKKKNTST